MNRNQPPTTRSAFDGHARQGFFYGLAAYAAWGLLPLYFKTLASVSPLQVLAHRVLWSFLLLILIVTAGRRWGDFLRAMRSPRVMAILTCSTVLIAINWFTYIYAVSTDRVLQSSLGYFITPLVNVALGVIVLGERLRPLQITAIAFAVAGLLCLTADGGQFPWISIFLALSFSLYALARKTVPVDSLLGLFIETLLLLPMTAALVGYWTATGESSFSGGGRTAGLLAFSGVVTAVPLLFFAGAARRLHLSTLGFLQYLSPTLQFLVAVIAFREPFGTAKAVSFGLIWTAVAIYSAGSWLAYRDGRDVPGEMSDTDADSSPDERRRRQELEAIVDERP